MSEHDRIMQNKPDTVNDCKPNATKQKGAEIKIKTTTAQSKTSEK